MFTTSTPQFPTPGFGFGQSPAYAAAALGNGANFRREQARREQGLSATQQGNMSRYNLASRQHAMNLYGDQRDENDRFLRFGVNALAGLMR